LTTIIRRIFSLDLRALALYRGAVGLLVILDTLMRWRDLVPHYTDYGILPSAPYLEKFANRFHWSLHLASGTEMWATFLFGLTLFAGVTLLLGYRTRVSSIACWVLIVSVQNRNPMILNGGDVLFRQLLFWGMLLPWHARWSVDRAMAIASGETQATENRWLSFVSFAVIAQVCFVYWTTVALKTGKEWWPEGTASYYALALDQFTTRFGVWMSQHHTLLWLGTYFVFFLELLAPFMLLAPVFHVAMRCTAIVLLIALHLNFDLTMRLGLFPWIDIVSVLVLIPGEVFDWLSKKLAPRAEAVTIYYDGACNFCRKMALVIRELRLGGFGQVRPASDDPEIAKAMAEAHSWIVVTEDGTRHLRWDAWVVILEASPFCGWAARRVPIRRFAPVGDRLYNLVAKRRDFFGHYTAQCLVARPLAPIKTGFVVNLAALLLIAYVGLWNVKTVPRAGIDIASPWIHLGSILRIDQKWNMFAPFPLKDDGWYVIEGERRDGSPIDVFRGVEGPIVWDKPELVSATYKNARWRKYMMNIWSKRKKSHRLYYARYLCRSWNADKAYNSQLVNFKIHYMKEVTPPPGGTTTPKKVTIWTHDCYKKTSS
jgi:predicted DCC family thiol-disulfide oxidoreductase YuxK